MKKSLGNAAKGMTVEQAREVFDVAAKGTTDADRIARIELLREYFTNEDFRRAFADHVWNLNNPAA